MVYSNEFDGRQKGHIAGSKRESSKNIFGKAFYYNIWIIFHKYVLHCMPPYHGRLSSMRYDGTQYVQ